jgi:hypothetical protein
MSESSQPGMTAVEIISHNSKAVLWGLFVLVMFILAVYFAVVMANSSSQTIQTLNTVFIAAVSGSLALGGTLISQLWGKEANPLAPVVYNTNPVGGQANVPVDITLRASFSKMMDETSINADTFTIRDEKSDSNIKNTNVKLEGGNAVLRLPSPLERSTIYIVTITKDAKDVAGIPLESDVIWSFRTQD